MTINSRAQTRSDSVVKVVTERYLVIVCLCLPACFAEYLVSFRICKLLRDVEHHTGAATPPCSSIHQLSLLLIPPALRSSEWIPQRRRRSPRSRASGRLSTDHSVRLHPCERDSMADKGCITHCSTISSLVGRSGYCAMPLRHQPERSEHSRIGITPA